MYGCVCLRVCVCCGLRMFAHVCACLCMIVSEFICLCVVVYACVCLCMIVYVCVLAVHVRVWLCRFVFV